MPDPLTFDSAKIEYEEKEICSHTFRLVVLCISNRMSTYWPRSRTRPIRGHGGFENLLLGRKFIPFTIVLIGTSNNSKVDTQCIESDDDASNRLRKC